MTKNMYVLAAVLCVLTSLPVHAQVDITQNGGILFAELQNTDEKTNFPKLVDRNVQTKYVSNWMSGYGIYYTSAYPSVLNSYVLYSADNFPQCDPKSWNFEGSNDGVNWTLLDKRTNQVFEARFQRKEFSCDSHLAIVPFPTLPIFHSLSTHHPTTMRDINDIRFHNLSRSDYFQFSVSQNGVHLFNTIPVTKRFATWFMEVNRLFSEKFPSSEGYKVKIKVRAVTVGEVSYEELFPDPDWWQATTPEM